MFENLSVFENRYEELNLKLYDPTVAADRGQYAALMKEHKEITPIVEQYRALKKAEADMEGAQQLLDDPASDRELRQMAAEELNAAREDAAKIAETLKVLLLPRDPNDERSVIVEIRGGAGGEEAALFAYNLYRMYTMYAERRGWKTEIVGLNETELGGFKEVSFTIAGVIGVLSSVIDNVPLVAACMGMYPVMDAAAVAASADPAYMQSFVQDGLFWHLLTYCAGVGGSLLIIGSAAGVVAMGLEKINFAWYFKKITLLAFVGYLSGILVILLEHLLIGL